MGALAIVVVSVLIFFIPDDQGPFSPGFRKVASILGVVFGVICGIYGCFKVFDSQPGFVIDRLGIVDNFSAVSVGRIPWGDVVGFQDQEIYGNRFLVIEVVDPEGYLKRGGALKAKLTAANFNLTGS